MVAGVVDNEADVGRIRRITFFKIFIFEFAPIGTELNKIPFTTPLKSVIVFSATVMFILQRSSIEVGEISFSKMSFDDDDDDDDESRK